jgi:hypothetical protein
MTLYKKIFDAQLKYTGEILEASKTLQRELHRVSKLWDKTETMKFTLFSKKEILKLLDDELNDFNYQVKKKTSLMLQEIEDILKKEAPGSNE